MKKVLFTCILLLSATSFAQNLSVRDLKVGDTTVASDADTLTATRNVYPIQKLANYKINDEPYLVFSENGCRTVAYLSKLPWTSKKVKASEQYTIMAVQGNAQSVQITAYKWFSDKKLEITCNGMTLDSSLEELSHRISNILVLSLNVR